jgi:hypothetical protein
MEILEPTTDVVTQVSENPALAILSEEKFEAFYEKLKAEAAKVSGDVSTNKARDEVRSMAFKIAKTRAAIDKARLGLTEEWRTKTAQANTAGKAIKERLESLEEQVRKPLTDWEKAEADRVKAHTDLMTAITKAEFVGIEDTAESVAERIEWLDSITLDPAIHLDQLEWMQRAKERACEKLTAQHVRLIREELERAELELLREKEALRLAEVEAERERAEAAKAEAERLERLRQEAIEEAKREAEEARLEQERKHQAELEAVRQAEADRKAEEERLEKAREQAALDAKLAAERERVEADKKHQAELEAERAKVAKAEADRLAEQKRIADEAARVERERIAREQDREHRAFVMGAAKMALMELDIPEDKAREVVLAIAAGNIPAVSIRF